MTLTAFLISAVSVAMAGVSPDIDRIDRRTLATVGFLGFVWVLARMRGWL